MSGFRTVENQYEVQFRLAPADPVATAFKFSIASDKAAKARVALRLYGLRDLDAEEFNEALAAIRMNDAFGATPEERLATLALERRLAGFLNAGLFALLLWAFLYPHPYELVVEINAAAIAASSALFFVKRKRWRLESSKNDPRPDVRGLYAPAGALCFRTLIDIRILDWGGALLVASVGALAIVGLCMAYGAPQRSLVGVGLLAVAAIYGPLGEANTLLDKSRAQVFQARVTEKHTSEYRGHTSWNVTLAAWGPQRTEAEEEVSHKDYDALAVGQNACVHLYPGALRFRWYYVAPCGMRDG